MTELEAKYDPKSYEPRIWDFWMKEKFFHASVDKSRKPYTILMPPPNVTSQLHMGHGLGYSIQDLLIRYKRMKGFNACWLPGTDHAGIATQMMVEKSLEAKGVKRKALGREKFVAACQEWKEKYGGMILEQFKRIGFSCDWDRVAYTMDPKLSEAVRYVFVKLYEEGLIYRGERLVNWDCSLLTALSDDELENIEINGHIWTLRYPIEGSSETIAIATTRPETMFGDTAVAVNANDERYKHLIGKKIRLPFVERLIPIIADDYVSPEFGTGAVKITPAHDPNDFEVGKRHQLPFVSILNDDGTMADNVPERFRGMDRFQARKEVIKAFKERELFVEEKPHRYAVPHSDRSKTIIEPKLSKQWFVSMKDLAAQAANAAREEQLHFYPEAWKKTYLYWLDNIQDWCISRQLWWGHRIPIWYCGDCQALTTSMTDPTSCQKCQSKNIKQDEDVLDTWFSSALWPLSPFGWPADSKAEQEDVNYFYPSNVLVTGAEIIFLWVARMVMMGQKFMGKVPFKDIYFNAIVCDKQGRKFSKTLGNGIDPLEVIEKHGADAVRFTAISLAPLGGRVRMAHEDFETGAKFINKIWNAARMMFQYMDSKTVLPSLKNMKDLKLHEKWLLNQLRETAMVIDRQLETYRVNDAIETLYHFIWGSFCDWALECAKEDLNSAQAADKTRALSVLVYVFDGCLRMAHPIMPFVTEELWQKLPKHPDWPATKALTVAAYPGETSVPFQFPEESKSWAMIQSVISGIRSVRMQGGISPKTRLTAAVKCNEQVAAVIKSSEAWIVRLAGLASLQVGPQVTRPPQSLTDVGSEYETYVPVGEFLDLDKEKKRLMTEKERLSKIIQGIDAKLKNENFVARAPEEVLLETKGKFAEMSEQLRKVEVNLKALQ